MGGRRSGGDDADHGLFRFGVDHDQHRFSDTADAQAPVFAVGELIEVLEPPGIIEHIGRILETDAVFDEVGSSLPVIPLEM